MGSGALELEAIGAVSVYCPALLGEGLVTNNLRNNPGRSLERLVCDDSCNFHWALSCYSHLINGDLTDFASGVPSASSEDGLCASRKFAYEKCLGAKGLSQ